MMKITLNPNFAKKLDSLEEDLTERMKISTIMMANDTINWSRPFVDTGAFITSWSVTSGGRGRPRGKSSHGKPRLKGNPSAQQAKAEEGRSNLMSDISRIDFDTATRITLRNGAPHAVYVDAKHPHVKAKLRNKYG